VPIDRCANIGGPGKIVTPAGTYATTGDIKVNINRDFRDLESSLNGKVGKSLRKTTVEITAELVPIAAYAIQLITLQPSNIGDSIFGCTDSYIEIWGRDDVKLRFHAGALMKPPAVNFSSDKNLYGEATWSGVVKDNEELATLNKLMTMSDAAFLEPEGASDVSNWVTKGGKLFFDNTDTNPATNPFWGLTSEDGITVQVEYETEGRKHDVTGEYDRKLTGVTVKVTFKPAGLSMEDLFALLPVDGPEAVPGVNLADIAKSLKVRHTPASEGDLVCSLFAAAPELSSLVWSRTVSRVGELSFIGIGSIDSGTEQPNPLYAFTAHPGVLELEGGGSLDLEGGGGELELES
jgi:hypothetical protein